MNIKFRENRLIFELEYRLCQIWYSKDSIYFIPIYNAGSYWSNDVGKIKWQAISWLGLWIQFAIKQL